MEKMDAVKEMLTDKKRQVCDKAKELAQITRLKRQILTCEEVIRRNELEIGKLVSAQYEEKAEAKESGEEVCQEDLGVETVKPDVPECFAKQCTAIANAKRAIADLSKQIKAIRTHS